MSVQSIHQFAEKVALVTDGASEIGRAVALQLALQGVFVVVGFSGENEQSKSVLAELQNLGTLAHAVETDFSTAAGAKNLVDEVEKIYGRLDLLVNCLKTRSDSSFDETSETVWNEVVDANLKATFFITQAAIKLMRARPKAKIVNVVFDVAANETDAAFSLTQTGVIDLTKNLAAQLGAKFRVNAVRVGERKSESFENLDADLFRPKTGIAADDAARAVLFLLSSEAVGLSGQILKVV